MSSYSFCADYDKRGQAKCKKCKEKCKKGDLRIGKIVLNPFSNSGGYMKQWHHVNCIFDMFKRARATSKKITNPEDDIKGWENLEPEDQKMIKDLIDDIKNKNAKKTTPRKQTPQKKDGVQTTSSKSGDQGKQGKSTNNIIPDYTPDVCLSRTSSKVRNEPGMDRSHKDNSFREFRRLCANIANEPSYTGKTNIIGTFLNNGTSKDKFQGDMKLWIKLLLPGVVKRVYNLQSKLLVKLFAQLFNANHEEMLEDLAKGDVAETIYTFFEASNVLPPSKKTTLSIQDVDEFLEELTGMTKEEEQSFLLKTIIKKCTGNDLKMIVRLIKADLRINAGAKHILDALHSNAYEAFKITRNIDVVMDQIIKSKTNDENLKKIKAQVMTPVLPMLAEACKSVEYAFKKCASGVMYSEIKYDGERVQVHKMGSRILYFSRSLKPVLPHKVSHFKDFIPTAFPYANDMILDAEILMVDTKTGKPLPFGTLGIHKKSEFKDATVCLFVFDCLHYNGLDLMDKPIFERKKILEENMIEIKNHIMFAEVKEINRKEDLRDMINSVLKKGMEGLVLKDINSIYKPGKRHWLKIKKDYLNDGAMADTADLVVLGAWYGTGKKGGMMSVFLMGCYDVKNDEWCTVTKVHTGHDDSALERLQKELHMEKINQNPDRIPTWLKCKKSMIPDFVATDPKNSPIWEITGAEFTRHNNHTAGGISIRFPRVTRVRNDKTWKQATDLTYLQELYIKSKEFSKNLEAAPDKTNEDDNNNNNNDEERDKMKEELDLSIPIKNSDDGTNSIKRNKAASSSSKTPIEEEKRRNVFVYKEIQRTFKEDTKTNNLPRENMDKKRKADENEENILEVKKYFKVPYKSILNM